MSATFPSPSELTGAVHGTVLYCALFMVFILVQSLSKYSLFHKLKQKAAKDGYKVKFRSVKYYSTEPLALLGDRTVGNFFEQAIVFLPLFWMHALFVDPTLSWNIMLVYCASRILYPICFAARLVLLSTIPGYAVLLYLTVRLVQAVGEE